ncbi:hypothetical protein chiPu_0024759, partial [Chiloscyllium punctatum]|nr:hypothetical protein [Chiloscyllium punctatum]
MPPLPVPGVGERRKTATPAPTDRLLWAARAGRIETPASAVQGSGSPLRAESKTIGKRSVRGKRGLFAAAQR